MIELPGGWVGEAVLDARPDRLVVRARRGEGMPVILKATVPGAGWGSRASLRREARLLDHIRGDGVVALVDVIDRRGRTALVLDFIPAGTLADRDPPDPDGLVLELTAIVDRLGHCRMEHRNLRPEHVLLDADGHPVLCGFGRAGPTRGPAKGVDAAGLDGLVRALRVTRPAGGGPPRSPAGRPGGPRRP